MCVCVFVSQMTLPGEEPEQEGVLASLEEAAAMEETETLVGHSSLDEEEEEEEEKRENERHRRRRQEQQQHQQAAASGMEQLTYSRMTHLLAVYQNKVRLPLCPRAWSGVVGGR